MFKNGGRFLFIMIIYLIRHGETTGDVEERYGGDYDDNLTEKGRQQARELTNKLRNKSIQIIYHSPRIRAKETAEILNKNINAKLKVVDELRERNNYGVLTGLIKAEAKEKYPEEVLKLETVWKHHKVKGSEEYEPFKKRVIAAFNDILKKERCEIISIICHGGPITCIIEEILKLGRLKKLRDCGFIVLEKQDNKLKVISMESIVIDKG